METEEVTQEVVAPGNGQVLEILVAAGEDDQVNAGVCVVDIAL